MIGIHDVLAWKYGEVSPMLVQQILPIFHESFILGWFQKMIIL